MKKWASTLLLAVALASPVAVYAQQTTEPIENVGNWHPNLRKAQELTDQAYNALVASQKANEFDEGGHAQKAKELLDQVNRQIKAAAVFDNNKRKNHPQ